MHGAYRESVRQSMAPQNNENYGPLNDRTRNHKSRLRLYYKWNLPGKSRKRTLSEKANLTKALYCLQIYTTIPNNNTSIEMLPFGDDTAILSHSMKQHWESDTSKKLQILVAYQNEQ